MLTEEDALHEETPLLAQANALEAGPHTSPSKHEDQYNRFSRSQKRFIVALLSWVGLLPCEPPSHVGRDLSKLRLMVLVYLSQS